MSQSPDSNKGPHGSTYVIAVVAGSTPACPDWSSIQSIHVELLDPATFWIQDSPSEESKRQKENFCGWKKRDSGINKESGPEMVMNTIYSVSFSFSIWPEFWDWYLHSLFHRLTDKTLHWCLICRLLQSFGVEIEGIQGDLMGAAYMGAAMNLYRSNDSPAGYHAYRRLQTSTFALKIMTL